MDVTLPTVNSPAVTTDTPRRLDKGSKIIHAAKSIGLISRSSIPNTGSADLSYLEQYRPQSSEKAALPDLEIESEPRIQDPSLLDRLKRKSLKISHRAPADLSTSRAAAAAAPLKDVQEVATPRLRSFVYKSNSPKLTEALRLKTEVITLRKEIDQLQSILKEKSLLADAKEAEANELLKFDEPVKEIVYATTGKIALLNELSSVQESIIKIKKKKRPFSHSPELCRLEVELRQTELLILAELKTALDRELASEGKDLSYNRYLKIIAKKESKLNSLKSKL